MLSDEAIYADDADFITQEPEKNEKLKKDIKNILQKENRKVNKSKTEETIPERKKRVQGYSGKMKDDLMVIIRKEKTENYKKRN